MQPAIRIGKIGISSMLGGGFMYASAVITGLVNPRHALMAGMCYSVIRIVANEVLEPHCKTPLSSTALCITQVSSDLLAPYLVLSALGTPISFKASLFLLGFSKLSFLALIATTFLCYNVPIFVVCRSVNYASDLLQNRRQQILGNENFLLARD